MKIVTVVGARPQFVKAAVLSRTIAKTDGIKEVIIHTGQHFDTNMSDIFFEEMKIPKPNYRLQINGGSHGKMTGKMLSSIEEILQKENPDFLLVYGDTNSTLAGALAASKIHIPVAHVEAGLRSYNMKMPEEINRILTDRVSAFLFCPTQSAIENLQKEGFDLMQSKVELVGDIMYEAALFYEKESQSKILEELSLKENKYILGTIHRQENTNNLNNLKDIISTFNEINQEIQIVVPIHPRTRKLIEAEKLTTEFKLIEPIGYLDMIQLIKGANMIFTDSGGLQKEAYFFQKKCVTLREETEWIELVNNGFNILTGANSVKIKKAFQTFKTKPIEFDQKFYGKGNTSKLIINSLKNFKQKN